MVSGSSTRILANMWVYGDRNDLNKNDAKWQGNLLVVLFFEAFNPAIILVGLPHGSVLHSFPTAFMMDLVGILSPLSY